MTAISEETPHQDSGGIDDYRGGIIIGTLSDIAGIRLFEKYLLQEGALGTPRQFIVVLLIVGACGLLVVSPAMGKLTFLATCFWPTNFSKSDNEYEALGLRNAAHFREANLTDIERRWSCKQFYE